ncbi:MAG TPA: hypothetical protein VMZ52_03605 [Bryobacteraceae bacterium]|nr:hypothetical protein [Bryobacteraceae bacterium]
MRDRVRFERELAHLGLREFESPSVPSADAIDDAAAQPLFAPAVRGRVAKLLSAAAAKRAVKWNSVTHPKASGVDLSTLGQRLAEYLNRPKIEQAMRDDTDLKNLASDEGTVVAAMAHQFQQKIYASTASHDGKIGEGTLDALGFIRHRGQDLNRVDARNDNFHAGKDGAGKSETFKRLESVYRTNRAEFVKVAPDLTPNTWYSFFVNPPFLGRTFGLGIHVELMKRLRVAETRLTGLQAYAGMSPVELGVALGVDEDHGGGRIKEKTSSSMHTFGLAVDIGYLKNPWIAGQAGSPTRNRYFREVSANVSRLLQGSNHELNPAWLNWLGTDANRSTGAAFDAIKMCHTDTLAYLRLERDSAVLQSTLRERASETGSNVVRPRESVEAAAARWRGIIRADRGKLQYAFGGNRRPEDGFLNLAKDLVMALRDSACLAWGAIDLGADESGDLMHFDCRVAGIGSVVRPDRAHSVTAGHPCLATAAAASSREREYEKDPPQPKLEPWQFQAQTVAVTVAVIVSSKAQKAKDVELLVYAHGHNTCAPKQKPGAMPLSFITDEPFKLGKVIEAAGRPMILAIPFFDWEHLIANKLNMGSDKPKNQWHQIGQPAILNGVIEEILKETGKKMGGTSPRLSRLILAGHSGAYGFLDPIAFAHKEAEMSKGGLAKLTHIWGFETSYTCPSNYWPDWLASSKAPLVSIFFGGHSKTIPCGEQFQELSKKRRGKLFALRVTEGHCEVPNTRFPKLLASLP